MKVVVTCFRLCCKIHRAAEKASQNLELCCEDSEGLRAFRWQNKLSCRLNRWFIMIQASIPSEWAMNFYDDVFILVIHCATSQGCRFFTRCLVSFTSDFTSSQSCNLVIRRAARRCFLRLRERPGREKHGSTSKQTGFTSRKAQLRKSSESPMVS